VGAVNRPATVTAAGRPDDVRSLPDIWFCSIPWCFCRSTTGIDLPVILQDACQLLRPNTTL